MKYIAAIVLMLVMSIGAACGITDEELEEISVELILTSEGSGIYQPSVDINRYGVDIEYVSVADDTMGVATDIGTVLGAYFGIIEHFNTGDLMVTVYAITGDQVATYRCEQSWLKGKDLANERDLSEIAIQVLGTIETRSAP